MNDYIPPHTLQPTTPLRGGPIALTFDAWQLAKHGVGDEALVALYRAVGGYRIKPKRNSRGVVWNGISYWWSPKGYYRPGNVSGPRRPLQHYIWEQLTGTAIARGMEIWFKDRDRHNFTPENMELITKAELHKRTVANGEVRQITREQRCEIAGKRWTRQSRRMTAALLTVFEKRKDQHEQGSTADQTLGHLVSARNERRREAANSHSTERNRRWRARKKAGLTKGRGTQGEH